MPVARLGPAAMARATTGTPQAPSTPPNTLPRFQQTTTSARSPATIKSPAAVSAAVTSSLRCVLVGNNSLGASRFRQSRACLAGRYVGGGVSRLPSVASLGGSARQARTFTARATTSTIVTSAISDWIAIRSFAMAVSGMVSVGLNAVAFV